MLTLILASRAVAIAGAAGAAGWRDLRVDASSETAFKQSLAAFNEELSPERRHVFESALVDIWVQGTVDAQAEQREFTAADFYAQLHGLSYEEVVTLTDPSGDTAKQRQREATRVNIGGSSPPLAPWQDPFHTNPNIRAEIEHQTLHNGDPVRTSSGPHCGADPKTGRTGSPCPQQ